MLQFLNPWMALLAPLPILIWWLLPAYRERVESVQVPLFTEIASAAGATPSRTAVVLRRTWLQWLIGPLAWLLLVAAATRPQWVEPPLTKTLSTRDLLVAIDVSQSMETRDLRNDAGQPISRLDAVKDVVAAFIARRPGDRIGLILFGNSAHVQAPLTLDHDVVGELLQGAVIGMAGPQTMLGEPIGLGINLLTSTAAKSKVMILVTDGNDTGSRMPPTRAADIAAEKGITLYAIVVGNPSTDDQKVDMGAMRDITERTKGRAFLALDRAQLEQAYRVLDEVEPTKVETQSYRPARPLFWIPLAAAAALLVGFHLLMLAPTLWRRATTSPLAEGRA
jgi:Ca-activated chloride channel family protein